MVRLVHAALVLTVGMVVTFAWAIPARAADGDIQFSADGASWSATPPAPLFPDGILLVPGDSTSMTVWVRNANPAAGVLVAAIGEVYASDEMAARGFRLAAHDNDGAGLSRTAFERLARCMHLVPARVVQPNEQVEITVVVDLSAALTGQQAQHERVSFELWFGLTDAAATQPPTSGCPADPIIVPGLPEPPPSTTTPAPPTTIAPPSRPGGDLARTGASVFGVVAVGAALGGAGSLLTTIAARRHERHDASC